MADLLTGVHPDLISKLTKVLAAMSALGHPMRPCQGLRTAAQQQALFNQGRTLPGKVVTKCDGVLKKSNHQAKDDGFGHAIDCCFLHGDSFGETQPWSAYGACCEALGLKWGGGAAFIAAGMLDRPHVELP